MFSIMKDRFAFNTHCILTICLFLLLGNTFISHGGELTGVTDKTVKVGVMYDLTGPVADTWAPGVAALKAYFKMVNEKGGVHGRKIKYIIEDDRYSIPLALSAFKKLVYRDKVFALQAASGVGHTATIIPLAEKEKIPLLGATTEKKFYIPARKHVFGILMWYSDQAKLFVEYVFDDLKLKNPTIALMYPDTASGKDTRDTVRNMVKEYPVGKYKEVAFTLSALDYTSEILILKRLNPDIIYYFGYVADTSLFLRTAYKFKLNTPIVMIGQYACAEKTLDLTGKTASTVIGINCYATWDDDSEGVRIARKASLAYDPNVIHRDTNFYQGWFPAMLFYEGFKNAGRELTRESFIKGMESIDLDTQGICGDVSFSPTDHKAVENSRFLKADTDKNRFIPVTDWRRPKEYDF